MSNSPLDTEAVYALSTPLGRSAIAVVRLSSSSFPKALVDGLGLSKVGRGAFAKSLNINGLVEDCLVLNFPAPASYNGEHIIEIHVHGNPAIISELFSWLEGFGLREAGPGEFTKRAFLNNKISLEKAEGVSLGIEASSLESAIALNDFRSGRLGEKIKKIVQLLEELLIKIESQLDFSDEEGVGVVSRNKIKASLENTRAALSFIVENYRPYEKESERIRVLFSGRPNVGKSSLFNKTIGADEAIVSSRAGTTRDVVKRIVQLAGVEVELQDTAGIRDCITDDIELEGVKRGLRAAETSDLIFHVVDNEDDQGQPEGAIVVFNKCDLSRPSERFGGLVVSAKTGEGIDDLINIITEYARPSVGSGLVSERLYQKLLSALSLLENISSGEDFFEHCAQQTRGALDELKEIGGEFNNEKILDEIFKNFCIGK